MRRRAGLAVAVVGAIFAGASACTVDVPAIFGDGGVDGAASSGGGSGGYGSSTGSGSGGNTGSSGGGSSGSGSGGFTIPEAGPSSDSGSGGSGSSSGGNSGSGSGGGSGSSSGSGSGGGSGSSSSGGSGSGSGGGSGSSSGGIVEAGGTCPDDVAFSPPSYTKTVLQPGVCSAADITAFEAACGDAYTATACDAWLTANIAPGDAGGGTACGNCIFTPTTVAYQGAAYLACGSTGCVFDPNYEACVAIVDPTNGPACAAAWDPLQQCSGAQCGDCGTAATYDTCYDTVAATGGVCSQYASPFATDCATDLGDGGAPAMKQCTPGGGTTQDPDWTFIINLICGSPDGG